MSGNRPPKKPKIEHRPQRLETSSSSFIRGSGSRSIITADQPAATADVPNDSNDQCASGSDRAFRIANENFETLASLRRSISPPLPGSRTRQQSGKTSSGPSSRQSPQHGPLQAIPDPSHAASNRTGPFISTSTDDGRTSVTVDEAALLEKDPDANCSVRSPVQLTHVWDIPDSSGNNNETVKLRDILGDPMIRECWQFNYLFDVDFLISQFDEDVRSMVSVKVVHGSWKKDSSNRIRIDEACSRHSNIEPIVAYMPEPFGTHHSKMMILLRHDDLAQIIIHTANMIPGDWTNMCQAMWQSPLLPLQEWKSSKQPDVGSVIGAGARFKRDLIAYLKAYGEKKTGSLVKQLARYDFHAVRAALIASIPGKQLVQAMDSNKETLWGWPALKNTLRQVQVSKASGVPHIVIQISSIASLGQTDRWLKEVFFRSLDPQAEGLAVTTSRPKFSIIFPTPDEIRRSLNGYGSGGSIHMKLQSATQQKQLRYMRPYLCHWAGDQPDSIAHESGTSDTLLTREAGRRRAAPHIKTYIRFSDTNRMDSIDWAMVTSANLSTQAWGAAANANGEVRICSWEIGVMVWPDLFVKGTAGRTGPQVQRVVMVPCFKSDLPRQVDQPLGVNAKEREPQDRRLLVGLRMPYDLPLKPYGPSDMPWCATASHPEPDWLGQTWEA